jgi:CcmD family protein
MNTSASISGSGLGGRSRDRWFAPLLTLDVLAALSMAVAVWASLLYAGDAVNLAGDEQFAQRIFYFHIGVCVAALLGFVTSVVGSIGYLFTRNLEWDRAALAGVEVGTIFGIGILASGSIWAKPTWNTYWTWDPRLTTATITVLIYVAYVLFRNGIDERHVRARFASIYALFAFLSVPPHVVDRLDQLFTTLCSAHVPPLATIAAGSTRRRTTGDTGLMGFLAAAFIVLWLIVGLYVAYMLTRQRKLENEVTMLEEQLTERQSRPRSKRK